MRLGIAILAAASVLASACNNETAESSAAQEKADAEDVAAVETANMPPLAEVDLQPIGYDDIMQNPQMEGTGCSFFASDEDPIAILGSDIGFVKVNGDVQRMSPDAGSAEGPAGTRSTYDGREFSLRLSVNESEKEDGEGEGYFTAPASLVVVDGYDRELTSSEGRVGCGG